MLYFPFFYVINAENQYTRLAHNWEKYFFLVDDHATNTNVGGDEIFLYNTIGSVMASFLFFLNLSWSLKFLSNISCWHETGSQLMTRIFVGCYGWSSLALELGLTTRISGAGCLDTAVVVPNSTFQYILYFLLNHPNSTLY